MIMRDGRRIVVQWESLTPMSAKPIDKLVCLELDRISPARARNQ